MGASFEDMLGEFIIGMESLGLSKPEIQKELKKLKKKNDYPTKEQGFYSINGSKLEPNYKELAIYMKNEMHLRTRDAGQFIFDKTHYKFVEKLQVQSLIQKLIRESAKPHEIESFYRLTQIECFNEQAFVENEPGFINLKNGVLNVKTRSLEPHSPKRSFNYVLPHEFDPKAKCPEFLKFMDFVFEADNPEVKGSQDLQQLTFEIFGYALLGGYPKAHKAFVLYGEGRNGKSTWLYALQKLLGDHNTSAVSMKLLGKPFSMVSLQGKLANVVEESPFEISSEDFKNIVGGGKVVAAQKGKPEFDLSVTARLFFALNRLPNFGDQTVSIKDRLVILPFSRYIKPTERDTSIYNKIEGEMPGILNLALDGLQALQNSNFQFTKPSGVEEMQEEYLNESDSVHYWCGEFLEWTGDEDNFVVTEELFQKYRRSMEDWGMRAVGLREFSRRINTTYRNYYERHGLVFNPNASGRSKMHTNKRGARMLICTKF